MEPATSMPTRDFRFYGQFMPPVDQVIFERYFPDVNYKGVFVECGAFDGVLECSCKFFEESLGWRGYNLEPVPWLFEQCCVNRPLAKNIEVALSNTMGKVDFNFVIHPQLGLQFGNGSLAHGSDHKKYLEESGCTFMKIDVNLITWREFIKQEAINHIDLLVLDVEGHELQVIEGMHGSSVLPDVICVEVGHLGLDNIQNALAPLGYVYDASSHMNAFFIKKDKLTSFALRYFESTRHHPLSPLPSEAEKENVLLRHQLTEMHTLCADILSSRSWQITAPLRKIKRTFTRKFWKSTIEAIT